MTDVYLEAGTKRVFACAADWPGWCRSGRDEEQALPGDLGRSRRPGRFVARRTAWHAVDHAWEIQDRAGTVGKDRSHGLQWVG